MCARACVCRGLCLFPLCECVCVCVRVLWALQPEIKAWLIDWLIDYQYLDYALLKVISATSKPFYSQYLKIVYLILASPWIVLFSSLYGKLFWLPSKMFPWVHVNLLPSKLVHPCRLLNTVESRAPGQRDSRSLRGTQTCIKLTSFVRSTVLASHNDWQIIADLDFRCIYFLFKTCSLFPGLYNRPVPRVHGPPHRRHWPNKQTALGKNRPPHLSVAMHACDAA